MSSNLSALFNNAKKVALVSVPVKEEEPVEQVEEEEEEQEEEIVEGPKKKAR